MLLGIENISFLLHCFCNVYLVINFKKLYEMSFF